MDHLDARAVARIAIVALFVIRGLYAAPAFGVPVAKRYLRWYQDLTLLIVKFSFLLPVVWAVSPLLEFADYPPHQARLVAGTVCCAAGLWLFYRSHADLGTNWSQNLEIRAGHFLVTGGVYSRIRHPMYLASLVFAVGLVLVIPNYLAGPSFLVGMVLLVPLRLNREEQMMVDEFGEEYARYRERSNRLIPGVW